MLLADHSAYLPGDMVVLMTINYMGTNPHWDCFLRKEERFDMSYTYDRELLEAEASAEKTIYSSPGVYCLTGPSTKPRRDTMARTLADVVGMSTVPRQ